MNERQRAKSYSAEFKESAVKLAVESKRPLAQTARELGVSKPTLYGWVRQYHGKLQSSQDAVHSEPLYEELKRLRRADCKACGVAAPNRAKSRRSVKTAY